MNLNAELNSPRDRNKPTQIQMLAVAPKKTRPIKPTPKPRRAVEPIPVHKSSAWASDPDTDEDALPERGENAVQHDPGGLKRGRRSKLFPDLNITATAAKLGITKSHLAKVLSGQNKPSLDLALQIAEVLGKDLLFVAALSDNRNVDDTRQAKAGKRKKK